MLYNCGRIFFYYHFSLVISYHSVWLGLELFGLVHVQVHTLSAVHARAWTYMTITNVIIKAPVRKWDRGVNDVLPGSDGLRILVIFFWKKQWVEICLWARLFEIRSWARPVEIWTCARASPARAYRMRRAFVGSDRTVSIIKIVSLSPLVKKLKVKKS